MHLFFIRVSLFCFVVFLSWFGTTAWVSGPDMRVVSESERRAAEFIVGASDRNNPPCVLGDTHLLLALEGVSGKRIVGGGFPIDALFGQTDRVALFQELKTATTQETLAEAIKFSQRSVCWFALPLTETNSQRDEEMTRLTGSNPEQIGSLVLWRMGS